MSESTPVKRFTLADALVILGYVLAMAGAYAVWGRGGLLLGAGATVMFVGLAVNRGEPS